MNPQAATALEAAAAVLQGPIIRTSASVIGQLAGESVIVATTGWGYTVTVMLSHMEIGLLVRPRGWLKRSLHIEGTPPELVRHVLDPEHEERLRILSPMLLELSPSALRLEHKYGSDVAAALHLAVDLAGRAHKAQERASAHERMEITA